MPKLASTYTYETTHTKTAENLSKLHSIKLQINLRWKAAFLMSSSPLTFDWCWILAAYLKVHHVIQWKKWRTKMIPKYCKKEGTTVISVIISKDFSFWQSWIQTELFLTLSEDFLTYNEERVGKEILFSIWIVVKISLRSPGWPLIEIDQYFLIDKIISQYICLHFV